MIDENKTGRVARYKKAMGFFCFEGGGIEEN